MPDEVRARLTALIDRLKPNDRRLSRCARTGSDHFSSERPWIEGWIGFRTAQRFEGDAMPDEVRARLTALIDRLKPND
ncbi:hypothetical protein CTI14_64650, partial [Methylobacterium radiotolerans]